MKINNDFILGIFFGRLCCSYDKTCVGILFITPLYETIFLLFAKFTLSCVMSLSWKVFCYFDSTLALVLLSRVSRQNNKQNVI